MSFSRTSLVAALGVVAGMLWFFAAPAALGGQVHPYTIAGTSMEPNLSAGDLVLVRPARAYAAGDVVAYRAPTIGAVLVHRVISIDGDVVTLQGDNNPEPDIDRPSVDALIGTVFLRIPGGGRAARALASPAVILALFATHVVRTRRRKPATGRSMPAFLGAVLGDPAQVRAIGALLGVVAVGCVAVAGSFALGRSTTSPSFPFEHQGSFSYEAPAPVQVYPDGVARTGDAVFVGTTDTLRIGFAYRFSSPSDHEVSGRIALRATLGDGQGWTRRMTLVPETPFTGDVAETAGNLDLRKIERIRDEIERVTGVRRGYYRLEIQPAVELEGEVGGGTLKDAFTPILVLDHDGSVIRYVADPAADAIEPRRSGSVVGGPVVTPRNAVLFGHAVPGSVAASVLVAIGALLGAAALRLHRLGTGQGPNPGRLPVRFATRIVRIEHLPEGPAVPLGDRGAFTRLASRSDGPIFERRATGGVTWLLDHGGRTYVHVEPSDEIIDRDVAEIVGAW